MICAHFRLDFTNRNTYVRVGIPAVGLIACGKLFADALWKFVFKFNLWLFCSSSRLPLPLQTLLLLRSKFQPTAIRITQDMVNMASMHSMPRQRTCQATTEMNQSNYLQTHSKRHTKCEKNLNVARLVLQLSLPNPLKLGVNLRMKMQLEQHLQAMLQLHLSDQNV